jgi:hypothetical protein
MALEALKALRSRLDVLVVCVLVFMVGNGGCLLGAFGLRASGFLNVFLVRRV